ncbi:hypothetical protein N7462_000946 [Penicillium macrosclerotiorum]|uniref:uncharacterized protein n=1 Tax=Penicillium macrosclerotiorum TaxID=303699 RepID=UPI002546CEE5|nr:uncharacterized protein N7462_000946 [Penicillium macrosclerotiorum]KAJ5698941.1 hypothetical protein N7462_000946 [Penicillium macrosclerotiorum]
MAALPNLCLSDILGIKLPENTDPERVHCFVPRGSKSCEHRLAKDRVDKARYILFRSVFRNKEFESVDKYMIECLVKELHHADRHPRQRSPSGKTYKDEIESEWLEMLEQYYQGTASSCPTSIAASIPTPIPVPSPPLPKEEVLATASDYSPGEVSYPSLPAPDSPGPNDLEDAGSVSSESPRPLLHRDFTPFDLSTRRPAYTSIASTSSPDQSSSPISFSLPLLLTFICNLFFDLSVKVRGVVCIQRTSSVDQHHHRDDTPKPASVTRVFVQLGIQSTSGWMRGLLYVVAFQIVRSSIFRGW